MSEDRIIKAMLMNDEVKVIAISAKEMVAKAKEIHNTSRVCTAALGRQLMATSMMAARLKNKTDSMTTVIKGGGPAGSIVCTGYPGGIVKGYIANPEVELPLNSVGKLDVSGAVGSTGKLTVIRDLSMREPYVGECNLMTGEIAEDFAQYFTASEQEPSLVYLGVRVEPATGAVRAGGGIIAQPMPQCSDETIDILQSHADDIAGLSALLDGGATLEEALNTIFGDMELEILECMEPAFRCDCSRERVERALIAMGLDELNSILEEDGQAELTCHFCNRKYQFSGEDLKQLIREATCQ